MSSTPNADDLFRARWLALDDEDCIRQLYKRFRLTAALHDEASSGGASAELVADLKRECQLFAPVSSATKLPEPERHASELLNAEGVQFLLRRAKSSSSAVATALCARLLWLRARDQHPASGRWASDAFEKWFNALSKHVLATSASDLCLESIGVLTGALEIAKHSNQTEILIRLGQAATTLATKLPAVALGRWTLEFSELLVSLPKKARTGIDSQTVSDCLIAQLDIYKSTNSHLYRAFIEADLKLRSTFGLVARSEYGPKAIAISFENDADHAPSAFNAIEALRSAVEAFRVVPGCDEDVNRALKKLEDATRRIPSELQINEVSAPIPTAQLEPYFDMYEKASIADALKMLALDINMRIDISQIREAINEQAQNFVFMHLARPVVLKADGTTYSPTDEDERDAFHMAQQAKITMQVRWQIMLCEHWTRLRNKGLSISAIVEHIMISNVFTPEDQPFLECFAKHWLTNDFISAMHVIVPRIEHILRRLCRTLGRPTITVRDNGNQQTSIESALAFLMPINESLFYELNLVLADQAGYAIRHMLAHGLAAPNDGAYSPFMADTLLLLLVRFAQLHLSNS